MIGKQRQPEFSEERRPSGCRPALSRMDVGLDEGASGGEDGLRLCVLGGAGVVLGVPLGCQLVG